MFKQTILATIGVLISGCSLAPKYERPEIPVAAQYPDYGFEETVQPHLDLGWESFFDDPRLVELIRLSLENNRDLRIAGLKVEQVSALYAIERSALIPNLDAIGDGSRTRTPGDLTTTGQPVTRDNYRVGVGIPSYELDFLGRVRQLKDQVLAQYLATEEAHRSAQLSLVSAVARQYLRLLVAEEQLNLTKQRLRASEEAFDLNKETYEAGISTELDLRSAESQLAAVRSSLVGIEQSHAKLKNGLVELVGSPLPNDLPEGTSLELFEQREAIPAGLPSDLLTQRPDIRAAEYQLKAANANIGIARAAFFPSVKLTAFGGTASAELSGLFEDGSGMWSFAPSITLPLFAGGKNKAQLKAAKVKAAIEIANYEKTIQTAFREVADALAVQALINAQIEADASRRVASQRRYDLSYQRFEAGVDSFLPVLLAQQELFSAEQSLIESRLSKATNAIRLYAALGGWFEENDSLASN